MEKAQQNRILFMLRDSCREEQAKRESGHSESKAPAICRNRRNQEAQGHCKNSPQEHTNKKQVDPGRRGGWCQEHS